MAKKILLSLLPLLLIQVSSSVFAEKASSMSSGKSALLGVPSENAAEQLSAQEAEKRFNVFYQTTFIGQNKPAMNAAYSGMNSLRASNENAYTWSTTAHVGWRIAPKTEAFLNVEAVSGVPFSDLTGLGGFANGEATRAQGSQLRFYRQRAFIRHTENFSSDLQKLEEEANQFPMLVAKNRLVVTAGNFSMLDVMDDNAYAKDPRTQFLNWGNMTYTSYDYAADSRGFAWGIALEWYKDDWVYRFVRMTVPKNPNELALDRSFFSHYGDNIEIERGHTLMGLPGKVRVLAYRDRQVMGRFDDATSRLNADPTLMGTQVIKSVRNQEQIKSGIGLNLEQKLAKNIGIFFRGMVSDGKTETLAFTEADNSISLGVSVDGVQWKRPTDAWGLALLQNGLSDARKNYLKAGGVSYFIGDYAGPGKSIHYSPERILETYYSWGFYKNVWLTLNYQRIQNPAYNADRGPADFFGVRFHGQY
jgi:high affinity Mn2+ porin